MALSRVFAALLVTLMIGLLALISITVISRIGSTFIYGASAEHVAGTVLSVGPERDFILRTTAGRTIHFQCRSQCNASLAHLQRHVRERALTDVYFTRSQDKRTMLVIYAD